MHPRDRAAGRAAKLPAGLACKAAPVDAIAPDAAMNDETPMIAAI